MKEIEFTNIGTFWTITRPGGTQYGEGQGVITTKSSNDMATWTGYGVGGSTGPGRIRYHGSFFYRTSSTGELAFLNNLVGLFEYEWDEGGNSTAKIWERK